MVSTRAQQLLMAALLLAASGAAQPRNAAEASRQWADAIESGALGGANCGAEVCLLVRPPLAPGAALQVLTNSLRQQPAGTLADKLRRRMGVYLEQLAAAGGDPARLNSAQFDLRPGQPLFPSTRADRIDFDGFFAAACATPEACAAAWQEAAAVATHAQLFYRLLQAALAPGRAALLDYLNGLDARWREYLHGSRAQFPWELPVNGWRYRRAANLVEPPRSQLILLHPSAGVELNKPGGAALVLEVAGWNAWEWRGNRMAPRFGASAVVAWGASAAPGYGVLLHLRRGMSIGYVYRPASKGGPALLAGADVAGLFTKKSGVRGAILGAK